MNENDEKDVDLNNEDLGEVEDKPEESKEPEKETPKDKEETPEAKLSRLERQAERLRKKLGKEEKEEPKSPKSGELGYAEKAYLVANGIKGSKELSLAEEFIANTGKSLEEVVESKFFQAELKELREADASANATPKGTKRSGASSKDSVDYWLAKEELPENTPENQELRRKVVNARYNRETAGSKFSSSHSGKVTRQSDLK